MAEKKGQHLVPACYLSSFIANISEAKKYNSKLEAGVYVNSKTLDSDWKMRGINHKTFKKSYYYNLAEDNPSEPYIENFLSIVEGSYRKYLQKVENREINEEVLSYLSYFTTLQCLRVDEFISPAQRAWDQVAAWCDEFSDSSQYSELMKDIVKKQIPTSDFTDIAYSNARIIYNNTGYPFITSDNPVVRKKVNTVDLELVIPKSIIDDQVLNAHESVLFFFPLTPFIAYISCDLIRTGRVLEFNESEIENIFYLNYFSILNSGKHVYSSVIEPFNEGEEELASILSCEQVGQYMKVYTEACRLTIEGQLISRDMNLLSFLCKANEQLSELEKGDRISLVEVFENGICISGKRNCLVEELDTISGLVTFASELKLRI